MKNPDFSKNPDGLLPCIIQDDTTHKVLMLGYMNLEAYQKTEREHLVTFYSRSKKRLWTKGESSGNFLSVVEIRTDCDADTILIRAKPTGPVCHTGSDTCFDEDNLDSSGFLPKLEEIIEERRQSFVRESYVSNLFKSGITSIAQKVGEEAIELIIESKDGDNQKFLNEAADLMFHFLILLQARNFKLKDVEHVLKSRNKTVR